VRELSLTVESWVEDVIWVLVCGSKCEKSNN
jgi:hypothetical protein